MLIPPTVANVYTQNGLLVVIVTVVNIVPAIVKKEPSLL